MRSTSASQALPYPTRGHREARTRPPRCLPKQSLRPDPAAAPSALRFREALGVVEAYIAGPTQDRLRGLAGVSTSTGGRQRDVLRPGFLVGRSRFWCAGGSGVTPLRKRCRGTKTPWQEMPFFHAVGAKDACRPARSASGASRQALSSGSFGPERRYFLFAALCAEPNATDTPPTDCKRRICHRGWP
jgi:hypothetical protein